MRQLGKRFVAWMKQSEIEPEVLQWRQEKKAFRRLHSVPVKYGWKLYPGPCGDVDCRVGTDGHNVTVGTDGLISAPAIRLQDGLPARCLRI